MSIVTRGLYGVVSATAAAATLVGCGESTVGYPVAISPVDRHTSPVDQPTSQALGAIGMKCVVNVKPVPSTVNTYDFTAKIVTGEPVTPSFDYSDGTSESNNEVLKPSAETQLVTVEHQFASLHDNHTYRIGVTLIPNPDPGGNLPISCATSLPVPASA